MSTQANVLNLSSQTSARDTSNIGKKFPPGNGPDLLPIDEDIDEQQCSPVKPKKRTKEDSPFKRPQNGNHENSSGDDYPDIAVGGFENRGGVNDVLSFGLNSGKGTPAQ